MNIAVIGTGYVGLVAGTGLSSFGLNVTCVDNNKNKIGLLNSGQLPIYEPQLNDLVKNNVKDGRLKFSSDIIGAIKKNDVIFIAVGTPPNGDGSTNLSYVENVARTIGENLNADKLVVNKSTVPVGTAGHIKRIIERHSNKNYFVDVASNPEFLREGAAVRDFFHPDRVVLGTDSERALSILMDIYRPLYLIETPFIKTTVRTAELIKYAANSFLAAKISFINEMANICDKTGANITDLSKALGLDGRIGNKFLHAGIGFGGSCFPKDVRSLVRQSENMGYDFQIGKAVLSVNNNQVKYAFSKILAAFDNDINNKTIAFLGVSFKPETDDTRESPAIYLAKSLIEKGAKIKVYDPKALENAKSDLAAAQTAKNVYDAATHADAIILATEWNQFRHLDLPRIKRIMDGDLFFDFRNVYPKNKVTDAGFKYFAIGR